MIFRSLVGLKFGNFSFWPYDAESWRRGKGVFWSGEFKILLKTTDKRQFDVKYDDFWDF